MITAALKSYFYTIVALASILGSIIATPHIAANIGSLTSSDPPSFTQTASAQSLPHTVDHHVKIKERTGDQVRVEEWMNEAERNCEMSCTYVQFTPGRNGKAGLAYVADSPIDLSGAKRVHFFLMGDKGGEMVKVYVAGKNPSSVQKPDSLFKEKFAKSGAITLSNDWERYEISLSGVDLRGITAPFAIELLGGRNSASQAIYFKFIVYENQAVDPRFELLANSTDNSTALTADNSTALTADNSTALTADNSTALTADNSTALTADNSTALTADNSTAPNNNGVRENNNNNRGQSDENLGGNNSSSANRGRSNGPAITDPTEVDSDNVGNEASANNVTADTSDEQIGSPSRNASVEGQNNENSAPNAVPAVGSLVAQPGDTIILDGSLSNDPDGDIITYQWSQTGGPNIDIQGADTVTPTVTIPDLDTSDQITIDLVVSDGQAQSNRATVIIDVQYIEEIEQTIQQDLQPDGDLQTRGWSDGSCDGNGAGIIVECLTDNSDSTFVSSGIPPITSDMLLSFQDTSSVGINASNQIAYVTAQVTAKKTGASGFTSLIVDDPSSNEHYSTPGISVSSNSFEEYGFTWKSNPITGEPWTVDSLNSLVAGFRYLAGQGSIEISEFKLIVTTITSQEQQDEEEPASLPLAPSMGEEDSTEEEPASSDDDATIDEEEPAEEEPAEEEPAEEEPAEEEPAEEEPAEEAVMESDEGDE